jgi:hypothetical protein
MSSLTSLLSVRLNEVTMKLKDASKVTTAKQKQQQKGSATIKQQAAALSNDVINIHDTNTKAKEARRQQEQPHQASQLGQEHQAGSPTMQPDPLLLVALHVSIVFGKLWTCQHRCGAWTRVTCGTRELRIH